MPFVWTGTHAVGLGAPGEVEKANLPRYFFARIRAGAARPPAPSGPRPCSPAAGLRGSGRLPGDISGIGYRKNIFEKMQNIY